MLKINGVQSALVKAPWVIQQKGCQCFLFIYLFFFIFKQLSKNYWGRITSTASKSTALEWKKMGVKKKTKKKKSDSLTPMQKQPFNKNIEKTECSLISLREFFSSPEIEVNFRRINS